MGLYPPLFVNHPFLRQKVCLYRSATSRPHTAQRSGYRSQIIAVSAPVREQHTFGIIRQDNDLFFCKNNPRWMRAVTRGTRSEQRDAGLFMYRCKLPFYCFVFKRKLILHNLFDLKSVILRISITLNDITKLFLTEMLDVLPYLLLKTD